MFHRFRLSQTGLTLAGSLLGMLFSAAEPFQATGLKVGEVGPEEAVIWCRLTSVAEPDPLSQTAAAPGADGEVRVTYWPRDDESAGRSTAWRAVDPESDHTRQFTLGDLAPDTRYRVKSESRAPGGEAITSATEGRFATAPAPDATAPVLATVVTCQGIGTVDSIRDGHRVYREMRELDPDFFVHTGDILYYDKNYSGMGEGREQEFSKNPGQARQRWNRMFSYAWNREFSAHTACYYLKDDHDTLKNDTWPGQTYGDLTFEQGMAIFKEQTPSGPLPYRTRRWGKDLQIWLLEGRDFRSSNRMDDGPDKTILGAEQKRWLKQTIRASDATFKVVMSPGPVVGPDKRGKSDNHSNAAFQTEGDELREFFSGEPRTYVVNGDRHWQYASIDPETGLREYGCGPINAAHDFGGHPGYDPEFHSFFAARGGFLSILVERRDQMPQITFRYHDIDDTDPETGLARVTYEETLRKTEFGPTTLAANHRDQRITVEAATRAGRFYHLEKSDDLSEWTAAGTNLETRGNSLEYAAELHAPSSRHYRLVETAEPR